MTCEVKVVMTDHGRGKVWVDGVELQGVQRVEFAADARVREANQLNVLLAPERLTIVGPAEVQRELSETDALTDSIGALIADVEAGNAEAKRPAAAMSAEEAIEAAYWDFDARHKGYGPHKTTPQSERDAFKWAVRAMLAKAPPAALAVPAGWSVESLGPLDVRVTAPNGEKWRLAEFDQLEGFFYRFARAILAAQGGKS